MIVIELPVQYEGVLAEHRAVRERAGLFDVSHMGEIWVRGGGALDLLERLTPNDVSRLQPGTAQYSGLLTEEGTFLDDLLVYCVEPKAYLLVVNAANSSGDLEWIVAHAGADVEIDDAGDRTALFALQGPAAEAILAPLVSTDLAALDSFSFVSTAIGGVEILLSRTGYTGEDGFEIYLDSGDGLAVWERLISAGEPAGLRPIGLGARDTLRLEAGLMLHGSDIDQTVTPLEAGLGWIVKLQKGEFLGRSVLETQKKEGVPRRIIGMELEGRRIARHGAEVQAAGAVAGSVTSGTWSPTLEKTIALALVDRRALGKDVDLAIEIRGRQSRARRVKLPFYRRPAS